MNTSTSRIECPRGANILLTVLNLASGDSRFVEQVVRAKIALAEHQTFLAQLHSSIALASLQMAVCHIGLL